jgi:hypothetical protein
VSVVRGKVPFAGEGVARSAGVVENEVFRHPRNEFFPAVRRTSQPEKRTGIHCAAGNNKRKPKQKLQSNFCFGLLKRPHEPRFFLASPGRRLL